MAKGSSKFPLSGWEVAVGMGVLASFGIGLLGVYLSMPTSDYSFLKIPRTLEELQTLRVHLESYSSDYTIQVLVGYCAVYIFMKNVPPQSSRTAVRGLTPESPHCN